ncbi:MAG: TIM barrel protein [Nanoarchaeota archaeon]|nr:TIM barrel protein [Nanoarchaeota archaeon]
MIYFGPAGLGGVNEAISNLEKYHELGLKACEIAFTYSIYLKKQDAIEIGKIAKKLGIFLSIHAPYFINLNSDDKKKIEASKKRILDSCMIAHYLGAKRVVFHSGFYGKISKEQTYENIKKEIIEMLEEVKKNKWDVELCPEVMGKKNVFGSIEEISKLAKETKCGFCIDFAHILARYENYDFDLVKESFPQEKWQCHFSGIEYGDKGEKNHKKTSKDEWKKVLAGIPKNKDIVIINESPFPVEDSIEGLKLS